MRHPDSLLRWRTPARIAAVAVAIALVSGVRQKATSPLFANVASLLESGGVRVMRGRISGARYAPPANGDSLLAGIVDIDAELEAMRQAVTQRPDDATMWSDLAAVLVEQGTRGTDIRPYLRAFAATERALQLDPYHASAAFNRALALEGAGLRFHARKAWQQFLALGEHGGWSDEARKHLHVLDAIPTWSADEEKLRREAAAENASEVDLLVRRHAMKSRSYAETIYLASWGRAILGGDAQTADSEMRVIRAIAESLRRTSGESMLYEGVAAIDRASTNRDLLTALARAHVDYDRGRQLYGTRDVGAARQTLSGTVRTFAQAGSPFAFAARHYEANTRFDSGDIDGAETELRELLGEMPAGCRALRAQTWWQLGTASGRRGRLGDSARAYLRASELFAAMGEDENAAFTGTAAARILLLLGREAESWRERGRWLSATGRGDDLWTLRSGLTGAGADALRAGEGGLARALLTLAIDTGTDSAVTLRVERLRLRARAAHADGDELAARNDLARARIAASTIADPSIAASIANSLAETEARIIGKSDPDRAIALLDRAIAFAESRDERVQLDELHLARADAWRLAGRIDHAVTDLRDAVALLEERRRDASTGRSPYTIPPLTAYGELAETLLAGGDAASAFAAADLGRVWRFIAPQTEGEEATVAEVQRNLAPGTLLLHFTSVEDVTLVFAVSRTDFTAHRIDVGRDALRRIARDFALDETSEVAAAQRLGRVLLTPLVSSLAAADALIVVADSAPGAIPFAALVNPATQRHLIEERRVTIVPAATLVLGRKAWRAPDAATALIVADPAFDPAEFPHLPRLRAAAREAAELAPLYRHPQILNGPAATKQAILGSLRHSDIVHIAAHMERFDDGLSSAIVTAHDPQDGGSLTARDVVQASPIDARLVVLAGCGTADMRGGGGIGGLATAFLAAGARQSVGTLWDIEDDVAREFSTRFHRLVAAGVEPADALRNVQLQFLRSDEESLRRFSSWAAFQIYGSI